MAAIDPPTADLAEDDPGAPRSTRFDWDKIATEEAAKLEREEKEEAEAEAEKRSSSKNVDASARDPPRSAAEAEERRKRDALREAKDAWRAKDAADLAAVSVNFKLGRCLGRQGLHLEAEETLRRALAAEQLLVGAETPMVAEIVTEICKVKLDEGDLEMAGQLAAHAVSVWEAAEAAGYEEADVNTIVTALVRLAEICDELNRTTAAEAYIAPP